MYKVSRSEIFPNIRNITEKSGAVVDLDRLFAFEDICRVLDLFYDQLTERWVKVSASPEKNEIEITVLSSLLLINTMDIGDAFESRPVPFYYLLQHSLSVRFSSDKEQLAITLVFPGIWKG